MSAEKWEALVRAIVALQDRPTAGNCGAAIQIANEIERDVEIEAARLKDEKLNIEIAFDLGVDAMREKFSCCSGDCMGSCREETPTNPFRPAVEKSNG